MITASIADFREAARRRLPRFLFEYIDGGSYAEATLRRNVSDLADIALRQRVLRDVSQLDLSTELFGSARHCRWRSRRSALRASTPGAANVRRCVRRNQLAFPLPFRPSAPVRSAKWRRQQAGRSGFNSI